MEAEIRQYFGEIIRLQKCPKMGDIIHIIEEKDVAFKDRSWKVIKDKIGQMAKKEKRLAKDFFE